MPHILAFVCLKNEAFVYDQTSWYLFKFLLPLWLWMVCNAKLSSNQLLCGLLRNSNIVFFFLFAPAGGVIASIMVVFCLFWVGAVDGVGFESKGTTLNLATLPVAIGLYGYCYSGHAVFPNIYTSMANPNQFSSVLLTW